MSYSKGVYWERELIETLKKEGFSLARIAGSGHNSPADIIAIKNNGVLAIECKAHTKRPHLKSEKVQELKEWCEAAGAHGLLAWRAPRQEWLFLHMKHLESNDYSPENWISLQEMLEKIISTPP